MPVLAGLLDDLLPRLGFGSGVLDFLWGVARGVGAALETLLTGLLGFLLSWRGASAAAAGASAAATYRWWKYGALGLFSRILPHRALDQATRSRIFAYVQEHPGVRAQQIVKDLELRASPVVHHLRMLAREGILGRTGGALARRYYVAGAVSPADVARRVVATHPTLSRLHAAVQAAPGATVSDLAQTLALSPARVSRMAVQLSSAGVLERRPEGRAVRLYPKP